MGAERPHPPARPPGSVGTHSHAHQGAWTPACNGIEKHGRPGWLPRPPNGAGHYQPGWSLPVGQALPQAAGFRPFGVQRQRPAPTRGAVRPAATQSPATRALDAWGTLTGRPGLENGRPLRGLMIRAARNFLHPVMLLVRSVVFAGSRPVPFTRPSTSSGQVPREPQLGVPDPALSNRRPQTRSPTLLALHVGIRCKDSRFGRQYS